MEVRHGGAYLGIAKFLTCRQTDVNCYKIDCGSLCWIIVYSIVRPAAGCGIQNLDPYLEALVEELVALHTSNSTRKIDPASSPKAEELEEETHPGEGQTEVGRRDYTVRQFSFSLAPKLGDPDICMNMTKRVRSSRSRACSMKNPVRPYARQSGLMPSPSSTTTQHPKSPLPSPFSC
jgi:hypothetical protein